MTTMTLRGIDDSLSQTLKELAYTQGVSLNTLALRMIREAAGVDKRKRTILYHDLDKLAGTWSEEEQFAFENSTKSFEIIDEGMWK